MFKWINRILNSQAVTEKNNWNAPVDTLPDARFREALDKPFVRQRMVEFSRIEYERNPYYANVINTLANHVIGPTPLIIGTSPNDDNNNQVEDAHLQWSAANGLGKSLRNFRKEAALTGLGIMIPHAVENRGVYPVKLGFKVFGADSLIDPWNVKPDDRIINGIEYDKDWNIVAFHFKRDDLENRLFGLKYDTDRKLASEVIYWSHGYETGRLNPTPECVQGFVLYPYIRRFLEAALKGEEFRSSFPMAVELDPQVYGTQYIDKSKPPPRGYLQYVANMIPTLPVGSTLKGIPGSGSSSADKDKMIRLMASACALCINMPANLAVGDSSNSNMASAQVDIQPWKNKVHIDRFDLEPCLRYTFKLWWERATLVSDLIPPKARAKYNQFFPHVYVYDALFNHPDPVKCANARAIDLASGSTTLNRLYAELGKNANRELEREAKLLKISFEELRTMILASRSNLVLNILNEQETPTTTA